MMPSNSPEIPDSIIALMARANDVISKIPPAVKATLGATNKQQLLQLEKTRNIMERLQSHGERALSGAVATLNLTGNPTVKDAVIAAESRMENLLKELDKPSIINRAAHDAKKASRMAQDIAEGNNAVSTAEGFFARVLEKHDAFMNNRSAATRTGFAIGSIALGTIIANVGGQLISQSISGVKESRVHTPNGVDGTLTSTLVITPLSGGERVFKAAVGTVGVGAGIGGTILGFSSLFRGK